jgi:hypothetical protein
MQDWNRDNGLNGMPNVSVMCSPKENRIMFLLTNNPANNVNVFQVGGVKLAKRYLSVNLKNIMTLGVYDMTEQNGDTMVFTLIRKREERKPVAANNTHLF